MKPLYSVFLASLTLSLGCFSLNIEQPKSPDDDLGPQGGACSLLGSTHVETTSAFTPGSTNACMIEAEEFGMEGIIALPAALFDHSVHCGTCFKVTGPAGSRKVLVAENAQMWSFIDMDSDSFNVLMGGPSSGLADLTYEPIPCEADVVSTQFEASNPWYIKLRIKGHRIPIVSVSALDQSTGTFVNFPRTTDNAFESPAGTASPTTIREPYTFRVTDIAGETITLTDIPLGADDFLRPTTEQFSACQ